jgi:heme/copper-type cytochrome/quinol oxidase subunit 2
MVFAFLQLCLQIICLALLVWIFALQILQNYIERSDDPKRIQWWFATTMVWVTGVIKLLVVGCLFVTLRRCRVYRRKLRDSNNARRSSLLSDLGISDEPRKKKLVGFFHPYWSVAKLLFWF